MASRARKRRRFMSSTSRLTVKRYGIAGVRDRLGNGRELGPARGDLRACACRAQDVRTERSGRPERAAVDAEVVRDHREHDDVSAPAGDRYHAWRERNTGK